MQPLYVDPLHPRCQVRAVYRVPIESSGAVHAFRHPPQELRPFSIPAQAAFAEGLRGPNRLRLAQKTADDRFGGELTLPLVADRGYLDADPALGVPKLPDPGRLTEDRRKGLTAARIPEGGVQILKGAPQQGRSWMTMTW